MTFWDSSLHNLWKATHTELVAPTMKILAENVHVDFNGMGSVLASRGFGYLVANIFAVILQNIVKKHADGILILAFTLSAIGSIFYRIITIGRTSKTFFLF